MFINLKEAGSSDVKGGSSTSAPSQQGGSSVVSDLQFADVSGSMSSVERGSVASQATINLTSRTETGDSDV
ncbi:hypothetical protein PNOK_0945100 [Pyrrhoderma noxium]|uniref:Uncharacterized protein n=1 Tax=Pyrrhoderma noxium TaxID=2282107 RepID=A0A286U5P0_9AGAM|nr:hypothetical protein PNOK_0945100 [Pyrrhoderma noxium]